MGRPLQAQLCESCVIQPAACTWTRVLPDHATLSLCQACASELGRAAADRGKDAESSRLIRLVFAMAGEIWSDSENTYWFREPLWAKKQPKSASTWIPRIDLPKPRGRAAKAKS